MGFHRQGRGRRRERCTIMIAEISAAWAALNAATKALTAALKTVEDVKAKEAIADIQNSLIDVQTKLLAAQAQYEALTEVKRELEQKIVEYENWDAEAARYQLKEIAGGIFVYMLKQEHEATEPKHWLCPNCFQQRQKSILGKPDVNLLNYKCNRCSFDIIPARPPSPPGDDFTSMYAPGY
jgi:hypothetical protein